MLKFTELENGKLRITMAESERKEKAALLYQSLHNLMLNLYERWQDESEYEDVKDYGVNLQKAVEEIGGKFIKMSKRPFGFTYILADATYQMSVTSTKYSYKRIA
jgi:hypothetical protein